MGYGGRLSPKMSLSFHHETYWSRIRRNVRNYSNFDRFCSQNVHTMSANCFSFRPIGVDPLVSTVSGHPQFLTVWCPSICRHPRTCLYCLKCTKFVQLIPRKIIKIVATGVRFKGQNSPNSISAAAPPQNPLGQLTALSQTPSCI